jgi:hypothetical protein
MVFLFALVMVLAVAFYRKPTAKRLFTIKIVHRKQPDFET